MVLRKIKKGKLKAGQFLYYINFLVIHKVIDFMLLVSIWLAFSFKQFPPQSLKYSLLLKATKELSCGVVFAANIKKVKELCHKIYQNSSSGNRHQIE